MSNKLSGTICTGLCSQSKDKKDDNNNAPEEVEAPAAGTSTTKPGVTAFGLPLTQQVGYKMARLENYDKDSEAYFYGMAMAQLWCNNLDVSIPYSAITWMSVLSDCIPLGEEASFPNLEGKQ